MNKFKILEEVYVAKNSISKERIWAIRADYGLSGKTVIIYQMQSTSGDFYESEIFKTKEELIASLMTTLK